MNRLTWPVARLIPEGHQSLNSVRDAVLKLEELQGRISARTGNRAKLAFAEVKAAVSEGRRGSISISGSVWTI